MANHTCEAVLQVAVGGDAETFPLNFPYYFGPTASITSSATSWTCDAELAVTATPTAAFTRTVVVDALQAVQAHFPTKAGNAWTADAALEVRTLDIPFPYAFPFIFNQAPVTVAFGQLFDAGVAGVATASGRLSKGQPIDVAMPVTVNLSASLLQGIEQIGFSTLAVTASVTASMTRNTRIDANLAVNSFPYRFPYTLPFSFSQPASVSWDAHAAATLQAVLGSTAAMWWGSQMVAPLTVRAAPSAAVSLGQQIDAALPVATNFSTVITQCQNIDVTQTVSVESLGSVGVGYGAQAILPITVITDVTTPDWTTFWPFFQIS